MSCTGLDPRVTMLNTYHLVMLCSCSWGDRNVTPFSFNCSVVLSVLLGKLNGKDFSETLLCHLRNQRAVFHLSEWLRWLKKNNNNNNNKTACDTGDQGSVPGWRKFPGEGNSNPLQYSCLENFMDRGAWHGTVHEVCKESDTTEQLTISFHSQQEWEDTVKLILNKMSNLIALYLNNYICFRLV